MSTKFGAALRAVLVAEGITPAAFARSADIDPGNLSTMLNDKGRTPTLRTLRKIVRALPAHVDLRALILGYFENVSASTKKSSAVPVTPN